MRLWITGGAGFIGSACAVEALERGWEVTLLDTFEPTLYARERKEANLAWVREHGSVDFTETDIRDREGLEARLAERPPEAVLHLAAVAGVRPSIEHAPRYYDINVTGTSTLLEACLEAGVRRFACASSSSVYGGNTKTPFAEHDPVHAPVSPYAASKRALELLTRTLCHLHEDIDLCCLRYFTVYGPRQRPEMAIHKFMRLISRQETLPMFGDGSSGRDYTYIDDIVAGTLAALERVEGWRVYNLGGDRVVRLRELIEAIGQTVGERPIIEQLPMQPGDVPLTMADLSRSRQELGYAPQTSLEDGLAQMWSWYQRSPFGE